MMLEGARVGARDVLSKAIFMAVLAEAGMIMFGVVLAMTGGVVAVGMVVVVTIGSLLCYRYYKEKVVIADTMELDDRLAPANG